MINKIINFVELSKPHFCKKCEKDYSPYTKANVVRSETDSAQLVKCYLCNLPAHGTCINDDIINTDLGIVYLCQICYEKNRSNGVTSPVKEDATPLVSTHKTIPDSSSDDDSSTSHQTENEASEKKKKKLAKRKSSSKSRYTAPNDPRQQDDQRGHRREYDYLHPQDSRPRQPQHRDCRHHSARYYN